MKKYITDDNLVYILRLLRENFSDMFISKTTYNEDLKEIDDALEEVGRFTQEEITLLENLILERTGSKHEPANDDIPAIFFSGGFLPTTKDYVKLKMKYISKTLEFECFVNIKCQGTSSMAYPKKNFSIRTYEDEALEKKLKINMKGWGEQYKFVLKANYIDISHARNIVSSRLWSKCVAARSNFDELPQELRESPNLGAIDGFFVKVYHEGVYQGRYTFNIPKDPWMTNMDEDKEEHCLLCSENYDSGCFRAPAVIDESDWTDEIHKTVPQSILTRWNEVIDFVRFSSDEEFKNNLKDYFDVESLIDYYCFQYLICGLDAMGKNQIYITYDGIKWLATAYDMDSTWGSYWDGSREVSTAYRMQEDYESMIDGREGNLLYFRLEELFKQEIYDRYQVLRNGPIGLSSVMEEFDKFLSICSQEMIDEDFDSYPGIPGRDYNNFKQIRRFAVERYNYTDDCIEELITEEIQADKLYSLPQQTTFTGSNNINTGVKLFDTRKDWTIVLYGHMNDLNQWQNTAIIHCMYEGDDGDYPGLSIQAADGMFPIMGTLDYFPGKGIDTNTFKIAIVCEDGLITRLKRIDNFGVESYKATSANYVPVYKDLIIGSYQDENMNYGRYWNGTLYVCDVYDKALTGGELNKVLNNLPIPNAIVKQGYSPNGTSFSDSVQIDWTKQELYITLNLEGCRSGVMENVLSFGLNIVSWAGNNVHFYYDKDNSGHMLVQCMIGGAAANIELWNVYEELSVVFNNDGLTINGVLYPTENYTPFPPILESNTIQVGSAEGTGRSYATNYNIATRSKS